MNSHDHFDGHHHHHRHGGYYRHSWKRGFGRALIFGPLALAGFALFLFLGSWVTMLLWNALMPAIFGLSVITWAQALGLLVLAKILFGGGRPGGPAGHFMRRHRRRHFRDRWREMRRAEETDHPLAEEEGPADDKV